MYRIYGRYLGRSWEFIDSASTEREAMYLFQEYLIAYGPDWQLEVRKRGGEVVDWC